MELQIFTGELELSEQQTDQPEENFLGQYIPLHYHCNMLQDKVRVNAFHQAIALRVKPGMHVLELGTGTGILSYFAAQQGAKVTSVEHNPQMVRCAKQLIEQNSADQQVQIICADAQNYIPSTPVDVVICEMLHVALLREKQLQVIQAFKNNYLRTFSQQLPKFLPEASILMVQPVQQSYDFAGYYAPVPLFHEAQQTVEGTTELGPLTPYATVFYDEQFRTHFHWRGEIPLEKSGTLTGLRFITQNAIAIDVTQQNSINWPNQCMVLPVPPQQVTAGQTLQLEFQYVAGDSIDALSQSLQVAVKEQTMSNSDKARLAS